MEELNVCLAREETYLLKLKNFFEGSRFKDLLAFFFERVSERDQRKKEGCSIVSTSVRRERRTAGLTNGTIANQRALRRASIRSSLCAFDARHGTG